MASRRPLIETGGTVQEMPAGDHIPDAALSSNVVYVDGTRKLAADWDAGLTEGRKISVGRLRVGSGTGLLPSIAIGSDDQGIFFDGLVLTIVTGSAVSILGGLLVAEVTETDLFFRSHVETGTAPVQVTSTTLCTNLNSDLLDSQHGAYYRDPTNLTTGSGAVTIAAGGTNQNVTVTPSGTGKTILNGSVGIGTSSPGAKLDVEGSIYAESDLIKIQSESGFGTLRTASSMRLATTANGIDIEAAAYGITLDVGGTDRMFINAAGNVGINNATPNANAILDVTSTTKAFMPPRMTTTQKNAIAAPTAGMDVYDSTLGKRSIRTAAAWEVVHSSAGGMLSATATLDFPSIAAGAEATLTISLTGVTTTGSPSVSLGWSAALPDGIVVKQAWVSAADTVSVRVANVTGGAIDPDSLTCRATVTQF